MGTYYIEISWKLKLPKSSKRKQHSWNDNPAKTTVDDIEKVVRRLVSGNLENRGYDFVTGRRELVYLYTDKQSAQVDKRRLSRLIGKHRRNKLTVNMKTYLQSSIEELLRGESAHDVVESLMTEEIHNTGALFAAYMVHFNGMSEKEAIAAAQERTGHKIDEDKFAQLLGKFISGDPGFKGHMAPQVRMGDNKQHS